MAEYDDLSLDIARTKLRNLQTQIDVALNEDSPNSDVKTALDTIRTNTSKLISLLSDAKQYSTQIREQLLIRCNDQLYWNSRILGMIIRSNTTRNPFELYFPFRKIAEKFLKDSDVFLLMSSDWTYEPLTFPMTLEELPNFIIIVMPAPEADNVLAFPLAGHELGHSVWKHDNVVERFSGKALAILNRRFDENPQLIRDLFPQFSPKQLSDDMLVSRARDQAINRVLFYAVRQIEEIFCDYLGVALFGTSYLKAFRYLLAPTESGERSQVYPELQERAQLLSEYAASRGFENLSLERWFDREDDLSHPYDAALVRLADGVRRELHSDLLNAVDLVVGSAGVAPLRSDKIALVQRRFEVNVPVEEGSTLGELISGAWNTFTDHYAEDISRHVPLEAALSNLVLKSAEAMEFNTRMRHAG